MLLIGIVGTTIAPWMQFYQQPPWPTRASPQGLPPDAHRRACGLHWGNGRLCSSSWSLWLTIHAHGLRVETVKDAAEALRPWRALPARASSPLAYSMRPCSRRPFSPWPPPYQLSEGIGWERGLDRSFREAPEFYTVYTALIILGAGLVLIPTRRCLKIMYWSQVLQRRATAARAGVHAPAHQQPQGRGHPHQLRFYNITAGPPSLQCRASRPTSPSPPSSPPPSAAK